MEEEKVRVACRPITMAESVGPPYAYTLLDPGDVLKPYMDMYNSTHANISLADFLLLCRGSKYLPDKVVLPVTVIYVMVFLSGLIGNTLVCVVIRQNRSMWTVTNFYLVSLAVSDLTLLLLGLPNDLIVFWRQYPYPFGLYTCKFRALISEMSSYSSVLVMVAFSGERYLAVCHPLRSHQLATLQRARTMIIFAWTASFLASLPFAYYTTINFIDFPPFSKRAVPESGFCAMLHENLPDAFYIYELSTFFFFLLPLCVIIYMYWRIGVVLNQREAESLRRPSRSSQRSKKATIRMLGAVVIAFFVCWAPFHLQRMFYLHFTHWPNYLVINEILYYVAGCLYFFSATVNPVLYSLMSKKFREAFKRTLLCERRSARRGITVERQAQTSEPPQRPTVRVNRNGRFSHSLEAALPGLQNRTRETYI